MPPPRRPSRWSASGRAELLMKGSLHTDELMHEVTASATGLRTERRISHVFIMDVPGHADTLFITDAAINIFPDLDAKRDIVQNAIDLWRGLGLGKPRVAILSAVETVTPKIPSTIDAAALCKMAERGQITGGAPRRPARLRQCDRARRRRRSRASSRRSRGARRSSSCPTSRRATCWPRTSPSSPHADAAGIVLGRARADRADLARGQRAHAPRLLRGRGALCPCAPRMPSRSPAA